MSVRWAAPCLLLSLLVGSPARANDQASPRALGTFHRVSVVLASENIRTPISAFGHTFLVFHDDSFPEPDALAVDFSGDLSGADAGVLAALFTSIPGRYRVRPFRDVAFEYDDEDRDLWVYGIRIGEAEKQALAGKVLQQLGRPQRYNFVSKNCGQKVHELFLGSLQGFLCTPKPYSLPVDSIRALDRCGRIGTVFLQRSSLRRALASRAQLGAAEQASWQLAARHNYFPAQSGGGPLALALGDVLDYRLPREGDPQIRSQLFSEKKRFPAGDAAAEPADGRVLRPPSALELEVAPRARSVTLAFEPVERNYLSTSNDPLRSSTLEILRGAVTVSARGVRPSEFVPFNFEALVADTPLRSGLVRKLELAYRDWQSRLGFDAWEAGLQLGGGVAASASVIDVAAVATVGIEASALEGDVAFGAFPRLATQVSLWPYRWLRCRARYQAKLWHYKRVVHHVRADLVLLDRGSWAVGGGIEAMGHASFTLSAQATLAVFF
jgi:hypothetical protein